MDKFLKHTEKVFALDDKSWLRHANPMSVITRYPILPFITLFIYLYRKNKIGLLCTFIGLAFSFIWTYLNPRVFDKPKSTKNWFSKSVLGERVYINRNKIPVPKGHVIDPYITTFFGIIGFYFLGIGIWKVWADYLFVANFLIIAGKTWFLDRMVFLYDEMKHKNEEYKSWDY